MADYLVAVTYRSRYSDWLDESETDTEEIRVIAHTAQMACFLAGVRVDEERRDKVHILDVYAEVEEN
jgi:hypothetical protein